ncbi:MAG: hypothetical protein LIO46_06200, partial [Clostridiales bacterium]|nr:hypothetical protein [Clostridiales bacterium]
MKVSDAPEGCVFPPLSSKGIIIQTKSNRLFPFGTAGFSLSFSFALFGSAMGLNHPDELPGEFLRLLCEEHV